MNKFMYDRFPRKGTTVMEHGTTTFTQSDAKLWFTIPIKGVFNHPVVIMGTLTYNGPDAAVIRVRDVNRDHFKMQLQEWHYHDQPHMVETVSYMIVEKGAHEFPGGWWIEAGTTYADGNFN